jgi:D-3-phosphoglycerate dehydrogenase / 2-oxoglutarate reductase
MKILISDKMAQEGVDILKAVKEFQVDCKFGISPEELKTVIKDYDALIIRSGTKVTAEILKSAAKLKVIGRAGVGLDNVDLKAATKKGVVAMNTPAGNTTSTAEHTMSMLLSLSRNIPQACASLKAGKWERNKFQGVELHGKTLGIVGLGRIGSTVAGMAKGFGMKVLAFDPYISTEMMAKTDVKMVALEELIKQSDYITLHIPKSSETKNLISEKEIAMMKKGVRIINCARGGIIDEKALAKAISEGKVAGCAVDVYEQEPPPADNPLIPLENCVATPHLGASTSEAQVNVAIEIAENVRNALLGRGIVNAANYPSLSAEAYQALEPYIDLAERMGKFAGQLVTGRINEIKVTYSGAVTKYRVEPATMALVNGILSPVLGDMINSINSLDVAKERGINVQEVISNKEEEFVNLVNVEVATDQDPFSVWGTLTSNNQPRIVKVNKVYVEATPAGFMLFINNNDKPGIVGAVGTILGQENINIAGITFGRDKPGGLAISVVNVDSEVSTATIEKIKETKNILFVKLLKI